jgi:hypothetical protein
MKNRHQHYKTSHILKEIAEYPTDSGTITIRQFMQMLGDRSFCLAILIFSLPNSLPVPGIPGFSTITGIPIIFIGLQMMLGKKALWLPKSIADRRFSKVFISKVLLKSLPYVIRLEKVLRPRLLFMTSAWGERVLGVFFVVLAVIIAMPIPGGNFLPGLSMSLLALGMLERDGLFLLLAMTFILGTITIMIEIIATGFKWLAGLF